MSNLDLNHDTSVEPVHHASRGSAPTSNLPKQNEHVEKSAVINKEISDQKENLKSSLKNTNGSEKEDAMEEENDEDDEEEDDDDDFENDVEDSEAGNMDLADENNAEDAEGKPEGLLGFKYKRVLKHNCPKASMEPLPEGWVMLSHSSGLPIYLHKKTRVVTWSRPYCLLTGYVLKHKVPIHSIPCFHYQKNKRKLADWEKNVETKTDGKTENWTAAEETNEEGEKANTKDCGDDSSADVLPVPKVIIHGQKDLCLEADELEEYLERRFEFETLKIPRFQKWSQRRSFNREMRRKQLEEGEANSSNTANSGQDANKIGPAKLITLTVEQDDGNGRAPRNKKFVLNTNGKPMICILHEYAQRVLRVQPKYIFNIREDCAEPFETTIKLNDKLYGTAVAINKKTAKNKAALATLEMLIPGFKGQVESVSEPPDMGYFNEVSVTDSRVYELCIHTGQLLPYQLLTECLKRNQGITDTTISYDVQQGKRKSLNYTMKCGKHVVDGVAKNKKIGKQMAAQQILHLLHPKIKTWAELISLYGTSLAQERARRKQAEQEIFDLKQRRGNVDDEPTTSNSSKNQPAAEDTNSLEPNPELLAKLRDMMLKLQESRERKRKAEEKAGESGAKKKKLTPMEAAVAAGKGLLDVSIDSENEKDKGVSETIKIG